MQEERLYAAALLSIPHLGSRSIRALMEIYGSALRVWNIPCEELKTKIRLPARVYDQIDSWRRQYDWDKQLRYLEKYHTKLISLWDEGYPHILKETYNPPVVLYYQGKLPDIHRSIAVVGARKSTSYGIKAAQELAKEMAQNMITVVSGGARGIDTSAHCGALLGYGKTTAVVANGLDQVYPLENRKLFSDIVEHGGAVLSEYAFGMVPVPQNFPARNRIIAGLSSGVVVIEAALRSGALITADFALEEGRDVFAVPGTIYSPMSRGTNALLRRGAIVLTSVQDILEEYGWEKKKKCIKQKIISLTLEESAVLAAVPDDAAISIDQLILRTQIMAPQMSSILLHLQLEELIENGGRNMYIRK